MPHEIKFLDVDPETSVRLEAYQRLRTKILVGFAMPELCRPVMQKRPEPLIIGIDWAKGESPE